MSSDKVRTKPVPEYKTKLVSELADKIKTKKTLLIASCKSLPSSQFQEIKKKLRGKAEVRMVKKTIISRAIDKTGKGKCRLCSWFYRIQNHDWRQIIC